MTDIRPENCRFRLQEEGEAYPKSSCQACGRNILTGLGKRCYKEEEMAEQKQDHTEEMIFFLSAMRHWTKRDAGTFREENTRKQLDLMAKELLEKLCGTPSKNSTESSQETSQVTKPRD